MSCGIRWSKKEGREERGEGEEVRGRLVWPAGPAAAAHTERRMFQIKPKQIVKESTQILPYDFEVACV